MRREQHASIGDSVFMLMPKILKSHDVHVATVGAAAMWSLAQEEATLRRMPAGPVMAALLQSTCFCNFPPLMDEYDISNGICRQVIICKKYIFVQ